MTAETWEPASFTDFQAGDRIHFWTNDNGFNGFGEIWRTGTVRKVTAKTIAVDCDRNGLGNRAVIRRADWSHRCPQKAVGTESKRPEERPMRPRDSEHVQIVDDGTIVTALWIPDPEQAKDPRTVLDNILDRRKYDNVETIAEMTRHYKRDGADFSGWVVRSGPNYTDPIGNKRDAMRTMRGLIREYFER